MSKKYSSFVLFFIFLFGFYGTIKAVTNTASVSGTWETPAHWSLGHVPLATEDVVVPSGLSMTINAADVCLSLTINNGGTVTIVGAKSISIAGNFSNAGTFTAATAGSSITFNAAANSVVSGAGAYTMAGTIVLNMGATNTLLDVQSANFCNALTGSFTLTQGTWKMNNAGTLANLFNSGAPTKLTIPNKVVIESDNGTMNFCNAGTTGNVLLEGELFMNGGNVYVESLQGFNAGDDFQYKVVGAISPILKIASGNLYVFAGFNASTAADYINFNMSGGTMTCAYSTGGTHGGYSNNGTFQLQNVTGGQTVMTGGTVILQDADNSATANDLDMGGANVAATNYSVTGGTIQFGGPNTQASSTFFGISPYPTTNYPNFVFAAGTAKSASPYFSANQLNILSLDVNANMTFDISQFNNNVNFMSNNGTFALQVQGNLINGTGSYTFSGAVNQLITSILATLPFPSLIIANTGGATTTFGGSLTSITAGGLTLTSGNLTPGTLTTMNITGITTLTAGNFTAPATITQGGNWLNNGGTFIEGTGTVTFNGGGAQTLGGTQTTTFYNLTSNGGTITLGHDEIIDNTLLISTGILDASAANHNLTVRQNFTNNSAFTARNGTVTLTGNTTSPVNIDGNVNTTFYNLIANPTNATDITLLSRPMTVNNNFTISNGTFNSQNFQITGNAAGTFTMAANTSLILGLTTVATNILFPTAFTAAHCALNATSTVTYQANINQTVSAVPTYGNVILSNGNAASIKMPTGTPLTIKGNLTLSKGAGVLTLRENANGINLTGNYTSNGILTFTTGAFNIGGNFTNNGTFNAGAGASIVTFNGTANQFLGGTTATTFNLLTINNTGSATITLGNNTTVSSNFTITQGTLDVSASSYNLIVNGNFSNSGGFNSRAGTVTLSGAANQNITGSSLTAFNNLTLSGHTITLNHNESVASVLTLTTGALNGPDSMITISNAIGTARIAPVPAASSIGAGFIMQRYITGTAASYQALASPAKADILKDWAYDPGFYMSGVGGPDGNAMHGAYIYYSVYTYSEPTNKYDSVNTVNQALTPCLGFYLWMGNSLSSFAPFTFATKGIPNVANINYNVTKSNTGNNLIGNPYESPINWTTFRAGNAARLSNIFYCYDETTGSWESSNGVTASGGRLLSNPNNISAHQGFMVACTSAGVITFREAHKSVNDAPLIRIAESNVLRLSLTTNANTFSGHAIIQFDDSASDLYSIDEDALHIPGLMDNVPAIYTMSSDGQQLTHNVLPANGNKDVTFYAGTGDEGMYTINFTGVNSASKYNCILLQDVKNNKWMEVTEGSSYSFALDTKGQSYKFILHFQTLQPGQDCTIPQGTTTGEDATSGIDIFQSQVGAQVRFTLPTAQDAIISVYNMLGEKVGEDISCSAFDNTVEVPLPAANAMYIVRVQTPGGVKNQRIYR
jgi:hypothetical protein